jgi:hypothetical protein
MNLDTSGDAYIILSSSEYTYMQCAGDQNVGFQLEYQAGSVDEHYQATEAPLDTDTIILKFSEYLAGKPSWKDGVKWKKISWY